MAESGRADSGEVVQRPIKPSSRHFFINGELVRFIAANRGANIVYLQNIVEDKQQTMLLSDFKRQRKRAYSMVNAARILNRTHTQLNKYIKAGLINPPIANRAGGERAFHILSYYSEDDIFEIREAMSTIHRGRPRKDGLISNSVLTEQELRAKMGDALMLFTQTADGRFVPVWSERTY